MESQDDKLSADSVNFNSAFTQSGFWKTVKSAELLARLEENSCRCLCACDWVKVYGAMVQFYTIIGKIVVIYNSA